MYQFPELLNELKAFLIREKVDVDGIETERQALYVAQRVWGGEIKMPKRKQSCFIALLSLQKKIVSGSSRPKRGKRRKLQTKSATSNQEFKRLATGKKYSRPLVPSEKCTVHGLGTFGAASPVRRIDPKTGEYID